MGTASGAASAAPSTQSSMALSEWFLQAGCRAAADTAESFAYEWRALRSGSAGVGAQFQGLPATAHP